MNNIISVPCLGTPDASLRSFTMTWSSPPLPAFDRSTSSSTWRRLRKWRHWYV